MQLMQRLAVPDQIGFILVSTGACMNLYNGKDLASGGDPPSVCTQHFQNGVLGQYGTHWKQDYQRFHRQMYIHLENSVYILVMGCMASIGTLAHQIASYPAADGLVISDTGVNWLQVWPNLVFRQTTQNCSDAVDSQVNHMLPHRNLLPCPAAPRFQCEHALRHLTLNVWGPS